MNTFRNHPAEGQPPPLTYWRRRFLALAAGLAVLAVLAWAFSGVLAVGGGAAASAGHGSPGHPARQTGGHGNGRASGSGVPQTSPSATSAPTRSTPPGSPTPASPTRGATQPPGPASSGTARACKPDEVVLSLFSSQESYGRGQLPEFDVDVVSTSAQTCAFNVGPRFLALVITAGGKRIWSSADCVAGPGSLLTDLARGVPTVVPLSWDREASAPGCRVTSRQVTPGSFTATASDGGLASDPLTFTLS
jgi:hypothetical protein